MLATGICLPPAGSGACVPLASAPGLSLLVLLVAGLAGITGAAAVILDRYRRGERDVGALLARPIQHLVSAGVAALIGVATLGLLVPR